MAKYIEQEAAMDIFGDVPMWDGYYEPYPWEVHCALVGAVKLIKEELSKVPAADVAPVVHGEWIIGVDNDDFDVKCSKCEWTDIFEVAGISAVERIAKAMHYCPNCGARMDGGASECD